MGSLTYLDLSADDYEQALDDAADPNACPDCDGFGGHAGKGLEYTTCPTCNGSGERDVTEVIPRG
jgi:DnaJ-class molecular chaperone